MRLIDWLITSLIVYSPEVMKISNKPIKRDAQRNKKNKTKQKRWKHAYELEKNPMYRNAWRNIDGAFFFFFFF